MASAGNGLAAKFIERGGVDILGVYNTGYLRMQGYGSLAGMLPMADANGLGIGNGTQGSVAASARGPRGRRPERGGRPAGHEALFSRIASTLDIPVSIISPTVAWFEGEFRRTLEATGLGYQMEIDYA